MEGKQLFERHVQRWCVCVVEIGQIGRCMFNRKLIITPLVPVNHIRFNTRKHGITFAVQALMTLHGNTHNQRCQSVN